MITEQERKQAFRESPILADFLSCMLQDLQFSESDEACMESRDERDAGTIYDCPDETFANARRFCDRFAADCADHIEAAQELEPGSDGLRYANGRYMTLERIGSTLWLAASGSGVTFTDDGDSPALEAMAQWARDCHLEAYLGDDGCAYVCGWESLPT